MCIYMISSLSSLPEPSCFSCVYSCFTSGSSSSLITSCAVKTAPAPGSVPKLSATSLTIISSRSSCSATSSAVTAEGTVSWTHSSSRLLFELPLDGPREEHTECSDALEELDEATDLEEDEDGVRERFPVEGMSPLASISLLVVAVSSYDEL